MTGLSPAFRGTRPCSSPKGKLLAGLSPQSFSMCSHKVHKGRWHLPRSRWPLAWVPGPFGLRWARPQLPPTPYCVPCCRLRPQPCGASLLPGLRSCVPRPSPGLPSPAHPVAPAPRNNPSQTELGAFSSTLCGVDCHFTHHVGLTVGFVYLFPAQSF